MSNSPELFILGLGLLLAATVLAGTLSSRFGLPALVGFLAVGMIAGSDGVFGIAFADYTFAQTIGVSCLIFILFSGGLDTPWEKVRDLLAPAGVLATVGVILSAVVVAVFAVPLLGFSALEAFLLGSVVASTDAAAVFAIMRAQSAPLRKDLPPLIELESGANDPMAIFLVAAAILLLVDPDASVLSLAPSFVLQMGLGAIVGGAVGMGLPLALRRAPVRVGGLALVVSVSAALLSYGLAGVMGGSGFLAAYIAGIVAATQEFPAKKMISVFQDGAAWLGQVVMFLTLGLLVFPSELPGVAGPAMGITLVLMFVARPLSVFVCLFPFKQFDWRAKVFVSWAGLRGAVPIVLATFPIVAGVEHAQTIFNVVFFVVLISSLAQGPTLGILARRLKLVEGGDDVASAGDVTVEAIRPGQI